MREKDRQGQLMVTAEDTMNQAQEKLRRLVKHLVDGGAPTMEAYRKIGGQLGHRPSWIQRVIGRRDQVVVQAHDWLNISKLCDRLDAASARNEAEALQIRGESDAARQARTVAVEVDTVTRVPRISQDRSLVDEGRQ